MNPYDTAVTGNAAGGNSAAFTGTTLYDGCIGKLTMATTGGTAGVSRDQVLVKWANDAATDLTDVYCSANAVTGAAISTKCNDDTGATPAGDDNWTQVTAIGAEHCVEKWNLADPEIRCVRMLSQIKRTFLTTDSSPANTDIDLDYRPYTMYVGWEV